jgi:hypothetical protein
MVILEILKLMFVLFITIFLISFMWYIFYKIILLKYTFFREIFQVDKDKNIRISNKIEKIV